MRAFQLVQYFVQLRVEVVQPIEAGLRRVTTAEQAVAGFPGRDAEGRRDGGNSDTWADDDISQSIRERESGGRKANRHSYLQHTWQFDLPPSAMASQSRM